MRRLKTVKSSVARKMRILFYSLCLTLALFLCCETIKPSKTRLLGSQPTSLSDSEIMTRSPVPRQDNLHRQVKFRYQFTHFPAYTFISDSSSREKDYFWSIKFFSSLHKCFPCNQFKYPDLIAVKYMYI